MTNTNTSTAALNSVMYYYIATSSWLTLPFLCVTANTCIKMSVPHGVMERFNWDITNKVNSMNLVYHQILLTTSLW